MRLYRIALAIAATVPLLGPALAQQTGGGFTPPTTSVTISGTLPAFSATPTFNFGTLNGAATAALQSSMITALGTPFQAGGSIGNTSFGISGTLPAFTATPTVNLGTLNGAATAALQTTINTTLGSPFQAVAQASTTAGQTGGLVQCAVTSGVPVYTTAQTNPCSLTVRGGLRIEGSSSAGGTMGNPVGMGVQAVTANSATTNSKIQNAIGTLEGKLVVQSYSIPEATWQYASATGGISNTTTPVVIQASAGAGLRNYLTRLQLSADTLGAATEVVVQDGAAGAILARTKIQTSGLSTINIPFEPPLRGSAATLMQVATLTATVTGGVFVNAQGYVAP